MNIQEMFDSIAGKYDFFNNLISLGLHNRIKKCAIDKLPLKPGDKVLDLCTGTGDIAIFISDKFKNNIEITAVDFSEKMLEIAREKAKHYRNINFIREDVMNLPFGDETFDAVFISFGLRNLPDLQKAVNEMKRVVKTGGYVVNLDTGKPTGIFGVFFRLYFFKILPFLGNAYRYLPESTKKFPSQKELVKIFQKNSFSEVKNYNYIFGSIAQQLARK